jgi:hypothetical protein
MTKIFGISGKKRSGKNTLANFMHGEILKNKEVIRNYQISEFGDLIVNSHRIERDGSVVEDMGILDLTQKNEAFFDFASNRIWPHVKLYHFADALKEICMSMFGLTYDQAYGLDKDSPTKLRWEDMPGVITPECAIEFGESNNLWRIGYEPTLEELNDMFQDITLVHQSGVMSAREVLQFVGTDIFRRMNNSVWVDLVINQIEMDNPEVAIIADCRFENEANAIKEKGGLLVLLERETEPDTHISEHAMKNVVFDIKLDNRNLSILETHELFLRELSHRNINLC